MDLPMEESRWRYVNSLFILQSCLISLALSGSWDMATSPLGLKRWGFVVYLYNNLVCALSQLKHNSRRDITLPLWRVISKACEKMVSMGMLHGIEHCWTSLSPNFACDGDFESSWADSEIDVINWWWISPWKNRDEHLWAVFFNLLLFDSLTCTGSRRLAMNALGLKR